MTRRRSDTPSQGEITEKVDKRKEDMREKGEEMDESVSDVETVRQTLESLEFAGTAEGGEAVEQAIEGAEDTSVDEFDQRSGDLEGIHQETHEDEDGLQERSDTTSEDLGKISDASGEIHSDATDNELVAAKESAMRDIEFLDDHRSQAEQAREESERLQQEYQARVNAGRDV